MTPIYLVIPAGGSGNRFGGDTKKQFLRHNNKTLLEWTLEAFIPLKNLVKVIIALPKEEIESTLFSSNYPFHIEKVKGGETRQESVFNGLKRLKEIEAEGFWLVHDAARPLVKTEDLNALIDTLNRTQEGALLALKARDTIKKAKENSCVEKTLNREEIWLAQTPQGAPAKLMWNAAVKAQNSDTPITDEASFLEAYPSNVHLVSGSPLNIKITTQEDWCYFQHLKKNDSNHS